MRAEIDVLLHDPCEKIDLNLIEDLLVNNNQYTIIQSISNNYLLLSDTYNNYKIRVHEDGRIYLRKDFDSRDETFGENLVNDLVDGLKKFLQATKFLKHFMLQNEINFSFSGRKAHSILWKKYDDLNYIGKANFVSYNLRTYAPDMESIRVKLESANSASSNVSKLFCN